jgi:hypothetical protein
VTATNKIKLRNFRCTPRLDSLLVDAAREVQCAPSVLLREFVREGSESILTDPKVAEHLRRKFAVA